MNCRARVVVLLFSVAISAPGSVGAQVVIQPTPNPTITAENERWYLNGDPISYAGNPYYPAGPRVYFNANEMVRSGFYMGIPLYTRTTIEPYSVVYLPVGPGVMQPYERPRSGALAQTSGSVASSLPAIPAMPGGEDEGFPTLQAGGSASQTTTVIPVQIPVPAAVGTSGVGRAPEAPADRTAAAAAARRPTHTRIGGVPRGSNSIFIEFDGSRWYKAGPATPIDVALMTRAGTYAGVPVWTTPGHGGGVIYVPVTQDGGSLAVPYSKKRQP